MTPDDESLSAIATRDERIARREARPLRRIWRSFVEFVPLLCLTGTMIGALNTFFHHEITRSFTEDATIACGFFLVLIVIAYLNPQVQQFLQMRGRRHD